MVAMKNNKVNRLSIHSSSSQCIDSVRSHFSFNLNSGSKYMLREVILVCSSVKLYLRTEEIAKTCEHYTPVSHFFLLRLLRCLLLLLRVGKTGHLPRSLYLASFSVTSTLCMSSCSMSMFPFTHTLQFLGLLLNSPCLSACVF